ncbi:MAG: hypothetical protein GY816_12460 [Cytophagales bacterium]|nr:hypothetical protein [Cytophagales bacterium]
MKQKTIWMRYLIIGISLTLLLFLGSCREYPGEGRLDVDIIYINETSHGIKYYQYFPSEVIPKVFAFEIQPNAQELMEFRGIGSSSDDLTIENCCEGYFEGFQGRNNSVLVEFDEEKCLVHQSGDGPTTQNYSSGYEGKQLGERYFEFTYRFTEEHYQEAMDCE